MSEQLVEGIAIIGLHGRFPGADSVEEFWANLKTGKETISFFSDEELVASGLDPATLRDAGYYVPARGVLREAERFDAAFFGVHPKEAEVMDPQQRIFLEACWEALERAGYPPDRVLGTVGVYGGATFNTYYLHALHPRPELRELVGREQVMLGNEKDYLATRVAYKLNLKGPAISLNTACSSSLVAVCQACQSLLTYQCDMALAGGVSVRVPQQAGYFHQEGNIASPDGHTRTFDASAKGTVFSNGVTLVVLKRLSEAVTDGDRIHAVIRGSATNNDGSQRVSFGAPGVEGQSEVVALAQEIAGVEPDSISYVEAHGTATPIGDPIEVAALTKAFRRGSQRKQFCALGSVKSNIGHLDAAAGTAGLIKTALALEHRLLPPSLHFQSANPKLELENSPFFVNATLRSWEPEGGAPLRAGVSSFGTGGTNAHIVVEEAPRVEPSGPSRPWQLLLLSAKTPEALERATGNLATYLRAQPEGNLADVAYTLQVGRSEFIHRRAVLCQTVSEAIALLEKPDSRKVFTGRQDLKEPPVVFMFPGQGAQYVNMGADVYGHERVFREAVDQCAQILKPILRADLRDVLFAPAGGEEAAKEQLRQTRFTQPALFTIEYALAQLWMSWGVKPAAMTGHSVGEYLAGCLADVFSLGEALTLVARRAELVQAQAPGSMLAVRLPEAEIQPLLNGELSIAAINSLNLCVVSGPHLAIAKLEKQVTARGIAAKPLNTSHAFHSAMMDPVVAPFTNLLRETRLVSPRIPYISNVTGQWITAEEATSPEYWAGHVRQTVRFAEGAGELLKDSRRILLEVGPGQTLLQLVRQHPDRKAEQPIISTLGTSRDQEWPNLLAALGRLWLAGAAIDWQGFYGNERRHRIVLPTYPFERVRYWPQDAPSIPVSRQIEPMEVASRLDFANSCEPQVPNRSTLINDLSSMNPIPMGEQATSVAPQAPLPPASAAQDREQNILARLRALLGELSGQDPNALDASATFFELGFDSLFLTQASQVLRSNFGVKITFRQLLEDLSTLEAVARYLVAKMPPEPATVEPAPTKAPAKSLSPVGAAPDSVNAPAEIPDRTDPSLMSNVLERVFSEQFKIMAQQLEMLRGSSAHQPMATAIEKMLRPSLPPAPSTVPSPSESPKSAPPPLAFGPYRPIDKNTAGGLTPQQQQFLDEFTARYARRTAESKRLTQTYRSRFADPRSAAGFRPFWKQIVYPIVSQRTAGSKLWDVDGNEYVDFVMGFGTNLLGHSPPFITAAIEKQLKLGVEVGPQSPLAGQVAELLCDLTGMERAAFANTGSEAVLAAIRLARTVTGRNKIVYFTGDYHGIFDEVLQRAGGTANHQQLIPVAPGIPAQPGSNVIVLDYGSPESLQIIRKQGHELAAVLVEPVQSRHPAFQPREFLQELRTITQETETALIFDEVITGFRCHPGGVQGLFGIKPDLATFGKLVGGGMPIGAVCGSAVYMDALDGGYWSYEDCSIPEVGVTFFAGTYVRHPLALAASLAMLGHLKQEGPSLQRQLTERMSGIVATLNEFLTDAHVPVHLEQFSSFFWVRFAPEIKYGGLLFFLLREKGIHIFEGRLFFLSTAHTEEDINRLIVSFKRSVLEMQSAGFLPGLPDQGLAGAPISVPNISVQMPTTQTAPPLAKLESAGAPKDVITPSSEMRANRRTLDFSLYFFGNYPAPFSADKYRFVVEGAKFADQHGFTAIWLPERHFHAVGGFSPNPSVIAAALARETSRIMLRGGSVVVPLHHPIRVAEEWAVVDNLSRGRVGISIASGWHPNDFVFAPDAFEKRRELCTEGLKLIRQLWRGQEVTVRGGSGNTLNVRLHPMPMQSDLPVWSTCVQAGSFAKAGELGTGVLAMLTNQSVGEVAEKIALYRKAFAEHGHDPAKAHVALLVHTFVGSDLAQTLAIARKPMCDYLRSYLDNTQKRMESKHGSISVDPADMDYLLERSFNDYVNGKAFIGTPDTCAKIASELREIGVDEVGCFVDFGIDPEIALANLPHLFELKRRFEDTSESQHLATTFAREVSIETRPESASPSQDRSEGKEGFGFQSETGASTERKIPLTAAQEGLWVLSQFSSNAHRAYVECTTLSVSGALNVPAIKQALQHVLDRHEGLRTSIDADGRSQTVHQHMDMQVPLVDLSDLKDDERSQKLQRCFRTFENFEFDLSRGPIFRALLIRLSSDRHLLVLMFHHIFGNGPSFRVIWEDLIALYVRGLGGATAPLKPAMQLSDFVRWELQQAGSQTEANEAFWLNEFDGTVPTLELPTDRPRPSFKTFAGATQVLKMGRELTAGLRKVGSAHRSSLFMTLLSAFHVLLHRLTGQDDVVVGVPFEPEIRSSPGGGGLYANTTNVLPLRSRIGPDTTFLDMLARNRALVLSANEHQHYFYGNLIRKLNLPPDAARSPLFSVFFNSESGKFEKLVQGLKFDLGMTDCPYGAPKGTAMFELYLNVLERDGELILKCDHNADLFDPATVRRWLGYYQLILENIVRSPNEPLGEINILSKGERDLLTVEWNRTQRIYPREAFVHTLFEEQALRTPFAVAVEYEGRHLTYGDLNKRAENVAAALRSLEGSQAGLVGICVERSFDMIVAILGTLKSGRAYVPLDPAFPRERLEMMIEDSRMSVILTESKLRDLLPRTDAKKVCLDEQLESRAADREARPTTPASAATPDDLAYVLFTSGSTGRPKGVQISHRAVVNFLCSMQREPGLRANDVLLAVTTLSFDIAGLEIFLPLITGAKLVIAPRDIAVDGPRLAKLIEKSAVTVMQATPSTWRMLIDSGWKGNKRLKILCGGEALGSDLAEPLLDRCGELWNMYGPTETTIWSTTERLLKGAAITIGRPIANTQIYIMDGHVRPAPIGVVGELFIGGDGVAAGYLNRQELTRDRFVPNPFDPKKEAKLYRTGDLARFRADGRIDFLGRGDHQVKIRGFRIELGEIEASLTRIDGIAQAVVVAREDTPGDKRLVAYIVPQAWRSDPPSSEGTTTSTADTTRNGSADLNSSALNRSALRAAMRSVLPEYMIPSAFVYLKSLPLTPNGKADRKSLPPPNDTSVVDQTYEAPRGEVEEKLAGIMASTLNVPRVGRGDSFFDLGGHSILAVTLFNQIDRMFGKRLPLATLFRAPTIEHLAAALQARDRSHQWPSMVPIHPEGSRPRFFCVHGAGGNVLLYRDLANSLGTDYPFYGLQSQGLDGKAPPLTTIEAMAEKYLGEIREIQPEGPYCLGGYCLGGTIAYEIAQRLRADGDKVAFVALLDTYNFCRMEQPSLLGYFRQKIRFHFDNVVGLPLRKWPSYFANKFRVARDGELSSLWKELRNVLGRNGTATREDSPSIEAGVQETNDRAAQVYEPKPYAGRVTLFKPRVNYDFYPDPQMGWGDLVNGELDIVELPVNPHAMLLEPYVRFLAEQLRQEIAKPFTFS
jgi:amino acid adenylation domain-containing protein/natural product biosynthesis luciferase-like monooxygenase protein